MSVVFRADASVHIGSGHVMRCLTLADALRDKGLVSHFLCRDLAGHMGAEIARRGHQVTLLPTPVAESRATWLGVDWQFDAVQCETPIGQLAPEWLIVDHYGLDRRWEAQFTASGRKIVVLDDLADRPHVADLLLDQTHARAARDYSGLVPDNCEILCGARHALLRPAFAGLREHALARRIHGEARRLLLSMGGYDADNATGRILDFLARRKDLPFTQVDVVLGGKAPWLETVRARMATLPFRAVLHVDTPAMPELIAQADLCLGAAGTSAWERCALGLPSILTILADNQTAVAGGLVASGAALSAGRLDEGFEDRLDTALTEALQPRTQAGMSKAAAAITDGNGVARMVDAVRALDLTVDQASMADAPDIWHWRFEDGAARFYRQTQVPALEQHLDWFHRALDDPHRMLLIIREPDGPVGHIRFDLSGDHEAEVGICLAPRARGRSLSVPALHAALVFARRHGILQVTAEVHQDNLSSLALFRRADFIETGKAGAFAQFRLAIPAGGETT